MYLIASNIVDAFYKHIGLYLFFSVIVIAWKIFESMTNRSKAKPDNEDHGDAADCVPSQKAVQTEKKNADMNPAIKKIYYGIKRVHWGWFVAVAVLAIATLFGYLEHFEFKVENGVAYRMNRWTGKIERLPRSEIVRKKNQYSPTTMEKKTLDQLFKNCDGDLEQLTDDEAETVAFYYAHRLRVEKGTVYNIDIPAEQRLNKPIAEMSEAEMRAEIERLEAIEDWWRMQAYLIWSTEFKSGDEHQLKKPNVFTKAKGAK